MKKHYRKVLKDINQEFRELQIMHEICREHNDPEGAKMYFDLSLDMIETELVIQYLEQKRRKK